LGRVCLAELARNVAIVVVSEELDSFAKESQGGPSGVPHPAKRPRKAAADTEEPGEEGGAVDVGAERVI